MPVTSRVQEDETPWFRQFWPWVLIALPLTAVIGSMITIVLALRMPNDLVVGDYYKQGLAINRTLERQQLALERGISARMELIAGQGLLRVALSMNSSEVLPEMLQLKLFHTTRADRDLVMNLRRVDDSIYHGALPSLATGRWNVRLEADDWRLDGFLRTSHETTIRLQPRL